MLAEKSVSTKAASVSLLHYLYAKSSTKVDPKSWPTNTPFFSHCNKVLDSKGLSFFACKKIAKMWYGQAFHAKLDTVDTYSTYGSEIYTILFERIRTNV